MACVYINNDAYDWKLINIGNTTSRSIAVTCNGNFVYILGLFADYFEFEGIKLNRPNKIVMWLGKFNNSGNLIDIKEIGYYEDYQILNLTEPILEIKVDSISNIYIVGNFVNTFKLNGSCINIPANITGKTYLVVIKYDNTKNYEMKYIKRFITESGRSSSLHCDISENNLLYLGGTFSRKLIYINGKENCGKNIIRSETPTSIFYAALDEYSNILYIKSSENAPGAYLSAIKSCNEGFAIIGSYSNFLHLSWAELKENPKFVQLYIGFVRSDGLLKWLVQPDLIEYEIRNIDRQYDGAYAVSITSDRNNNIYGTCLLWGNVRFGKDDIKSYMGKDVVFKTNHKGIFEWGKSVIANTIRGRRRYPVLGINETGNDIYMTSYFIETAVFEVISEPLILNGTGTIDRYVAQINSEGIWKWATVIPAVLTSSNRQLCVYKNIAYVTGTKYIDNNIGQTFMLRINSDKIKTDKVCEDKKLPKKCKCETVRTLN